MVRMRALSRNARRARLLAQFQQARVALDGCRTPPALLGGLALLAHQLVRDGDGIELLVDGEDADRVDVPLRNACGYRCVHRDNDRAEYRRDGSRLALRFARHLDARRALLHSVRLRSALGPVRVVRLDGLLALGLLDRLPVAARS